MPYSDTPQAQHASSFTFLAVLFFELIAKSVSLHEEKLLQFSDILPEDSKNYDKMKPPKKDGQPTTVSYHVTVMGLDSINEESMTYAADIFFAQSWKDHRLRLPENMTSDYRLLEVTWLKDIWRPDSFFKNAKAVTFQTMTIPNHYVWLYKDKTILYMVKLTLILSCAMNFATYPHDTQHCSLEMESHKKNTGLSGMRTKLSIMAGYLLMLKIPFPTMHLITQYSIVSHTTDDLIFDWHEDVPLEVNEDIELPQLDLIKTDRKDCTQVYSTGNFTCLKVTFTLKRRLGYYMFHTYIPTCLIVIMSWVSFWIRPEAVPARVTLGVTSLLTLSTQHAKSLSSLPPVSYIKAIDIFMASCTIFVFMSLMEYAVVNVLLEESAALELKQKMSNDKFEQNLNEFEIQRETHVVRVELRSNEVMSEVQRKQIWAARIDKGSRVLFPLSFGLLSAAYWIYFVLCI